VLTTVPHAPRSATSRCRCQGLETLTCMPTASGGQHLVNAGPATPLGQHVRPRRATLRRCPRKWARRARCARHSALAWLMPATERLAIGGGGATNLPWRCMEGNCHRRRTHLPRAVLCGLEMPCECLRSGRRMIGRMGSLRGPPRAWPPGKAPVACAARRPPGMAGSDNGLL
jgi:hypothetical protein